MQVSLRDRRESGVELRASTLSTRMYELAAATGLMQMDQLLAVRDIWASSFAADVCSTQRSAYVGSGTMLCMHDVLCHFHCLTTASATSAPSGSSDLPRGSGT